MCFNNNSSSCNNNETQPRSSWSSNFTIQYIFFKGVGGEPMREER